MRLKFWNYKHVRNIYNLWIIVSITGKGISYDHKCDNDNDDGNDDDDNDDDNHDDDDGNNDENPFALSLL